MTLRVSLKAVQILPRNSESLSNNVFKQIYTNLSLTNFFHAFMLQKVLLKSDIHVIQVILKPSTFTKISKE